MKNSLHITTALESSNTTPVATTDPLIPSKSQDLMVMGSLPWWGVHSEIRWALGRSWGPGPGVLEFRRLIGVGVLYSGALEYNIHFGVIVPAVGRLGLVKFRIYSATGYNVRSIALGSIDIAWSKLRPSREKFPLFTSSPRRSPYDTPRTPRTPVGSSLFGGLVGDTSRPAFSRSNSEHLRPLLHDSFYRYPPNPLLPVILCTHSSTRVSYRTNSSWFIIVHKLNSHGKISLSTRSSSPSFYRHDLPAVPAPFRTRDNPRLTQGIRRPKRLHRRVLERTCSGFEL